LGAIAVVLVLSPLADVTALFPVVVTPTEWRVEDGRLLAPASGVTVSSDGALVLSAASADGPAPGSPHRASAALAIGPLGLAAPLWAASPLPFARRLLGALLAVALVLVLLHAVAGARISPLALVLAALPLAIDVGVSRLRRAAP
jgi:hypothetical protein